MGDRSNTESMSYGSKGLHLPGGIRSFHKKGIICINCGNGGFTSAYDFFYFSE